MTRTVGTAGATPQPELLRLGIRGAEFRFGRALSSSEERQYLAAHRRLWGHRRDRDVLEMLARNVRDYESCRKELDAREPTPGKRMDEQRESEIEINRRFLAVLAAFRQFVDRVEARLKREYGKASPLVVSFKAATSRLYDAHFEYRFSYKLRNYAQHSGTPVGGVEHMSSTDPFTGGTLNRLHLTHDPVELLRDADDSWGTVRKDLEAMSGPFSVAALPAALLGYAEILWKEVELGEEDKLREAAAVCEATIAEVGAGDSPAVARLWTRKAGGSTIQLIQPPTDLMTRFGFTRFREIL